MDRRPATIDQVQSRGSNGASDEIVEIVNPTCDTVDVSGWSLDFHSSSGTSYTVRAVLPSGTSLAPGQHYLIVGSAYDGGTAGDLSLSSGITDAGVLRLRTAANNVVDEVGYYFDMTTQAAVQAIGGEGTPVSNLPHNNTTGSGSDTDVGLSRKASGTQDTGDNATDFDSAVASNPENTASPRLTLDCSTGVQEGVGAPSVRLNLAGPNPFGEGTRLAYYLARAAHVELDAFSVEGRRLATLVDGEMEAGTHVVLFRPRSGGLRLGAGLYWVRMTAGNERRSLRLVVLE